MATFAGLETEASVTGWARDSHQSHGASHSGFFHKLFQTPSESLLRYRSSNQKILVGLWRISEENPLG